MATTAGAGAAGLPDTSGGDAVDLAHLARQTMGDRALEREVLSLFLRQSETLLPRLAVAGPGRAGLAHTMLGSARGIGAHAVAAAAARLEAAAISEPGSADQAYEALAKAVRAADRFIRSLGVD